MPKLDPILQNNRWVDIPTEVILEQLCDRCCFKSASGELTCNIQISSGVSHLFNDEEFLVIRGQGQGKQ